MAVISAVWDRIQQWWDSALDRVWADRDALELAEDAGAPGSVVWCANSGLQSDGIPCHCCGTHVVYRPTAVYGHPAPADPDPFISPYPI